MPGSTSGGRATRGCVLLVDDEPAVLSVGERFLVLAGYTVLRAESSAAALTLFGERCEAIDLAVIDVSMPRVSGPALLRAFRERRPKLPGLLTSGYPRSEFEGVAGEFDFLQKPYKLKELIDAVDRLIGGPPRAGLV